MKKKIILLIALTAALSIVLIGCDGGMGGGSDEDKDVSADKEFSSDIFAMDTYMTVTAYGEYGEKAVADAVEKIEELDSLFNAIDESGEIAIINSKGGGALSSDCSKLISRALEISEMTDGAFTPAIFPIMKAWGFTDDNFRVPDSDELERLLPLTDISLIDFDEETGEINFVKEGVEIDFGGIAKGYTSAEVMNIFEDAGVESGLVSLGGNVSALGAKPDGSCWNIAIQNPDKDKGYLGVVSVENTAVITSGGYERYFEEDGITYHHIIDPDTGYPAESGLASVTVVCGDDTLADGLSTALFVKGLDAALNFWQERADLFDLILYTEDGEIYVTEGIAENFTSDFEWNTVYR